jgi:hypothetical protein
MPAPNEITPYVRSCVNLWLASTTLLEFSVSDIVPELERKHEGLSELPCICKSVSNELVRLETAHKLLSRKGIKGVHGSGVGRTPRAYRKNMIFRK